MCIYIELQCREREVAKIRVAILDARQPVRPNHALEATAYGPTYLNFRAFLRLRAGIRITNEEVSRTGSDSVNVLKCTAAGDIGDPHGIDKVSCASTNTCVPIALDLGKTGTVPDPGVEVGIVLGPQSTARVAATEPHCLLKKRIGRPFSADRCGRTMPADDDHFIIK